MVNEASIKRKQRISDLKRNIQMSHENMRSVMSVKNELLRSSEATDYDIITITETWLKSGHYNSEFISDKYRVFRKDRCESNITSSRGGGVLIAVREDIECDEFKIPEMNELEAACVQFPLSQAEKRTL